MSIIIFSNFIVSMFSDENEIKFRWIAAPSTIRAVLLLPHILPKVVVEGFDDNTNTQPPFLLPDRDVVQSELIPFCVGLPRCADALVREYESVCLCGGAEDKVFSAGPIGDGDLLHWAASIFVTRTTSVYHNGVFLLDVRFPDSYPAHPPKIKFLTKVFHPNINSYGGSNLVGILEDSFLWSQYNSSSPRQGQGLLFSLLDLLSSGLIDVPDVNNPLDLEAATMYINDRNLFDQTARRWTNIYAS